MLPVLTRVGSVALASRPNGVGKLNCGFWLLAYFAMYNAHFCPNVEGKIRMNIIHGYYDYIPWV